MTLFELSRYTHILLGFLALAGFWGAAFARKGSARHRRVGRFYLVVMALLLAVTLVMAVGMVISDQGKRATFNVYITLVTVCSVWMAWRSIGDRDDVNAYVASPAKRCVRCLGDMRRFCCWLSCPRSSRSQSR